MTNTNLSMLFGQTARAMEAVAPENPHGRTAARLSRAFYQLAEGFPGTSPAFGEVHQCIVHCVEELRSYSEYFELVQDLDSLRTVE